ncbi:MAG: signal peptidase I [Patescibacteria group bacterium]
MRKILWSFFEILETVAIAIVAVFFVRTYIAQPFLVSGASMEPNFYDGDYLLVDELAYRLREPVRGEVIVFKYPQNPRSYYIKRIIGLPGEKIVISKSEISITLENGEKKTLSEPYILGGGPSSDFETELRAGEYFMMGDNRNSSFDSRSWGSLNREKIIGLARFRLWPITKVMAFEAPVY